MWFAGRHPQWRDEETSPRSAGAPPVDLRNPASIKSSC
jgi:hypothetical protein